VSALTHEAQLGLLALAARAPSPHNIQPARWRFAGDAVELHEIAERWLSVGDPSGRDNQASLGMAWEGMRLALSTLGVSLGEPEVTAPTYPPPAPSRCVARGRLAAGAKQDPLADLVVKRTSFRGIFPRAERAFLDALDAVIARHYCLVAFDLPGIADAYDAAVVEGLRLPGFAEELYAWMRFSQRDPRAARDGLAADCLALSRIEALGASVLMRPAVLKLALRAGFGRMIVSEAAKVKSAARILLVHADAAATPFDAGRAWYRAWLALTAAGAVGVPMSALCDSPAHAAALSRQLPVGRRLVNVMRVGPLPAAPIARSARLAPRELLTAA